MPPSSEEARLMTALHDEHAHTLWLYASRLTSGDPTRAQDVVQETMLRAWRNPGVLHQSSESVRRWLFTVARRIVIDEWRSSSRRREVLRDELPDVSADDRTEVAVTRDLVVTALARLSPEHRQVLMECYVRDASVSEAALRLGIPTGTVKSRTHYALKEFRLAVDELGGAQ